MPATILPPGTTLDADGATGTLTAGDDTGSVLITVDVSAISGTPSLTLTAQRAALRAVAQVGGGTGHLADADYPVTAWDAGIAADPITGTGTHSFTLPPLPGDDGSACPFWRLSWTLTGSGSPSLTLGITADN